MSVNFEYDSWVITEEKSHILESVGERRNDFESKLNLPNLPEMLFADNCVSFIHKAGFGFKFLALDALKMVDTENDLLKVAYASEWKNSRASSEGIDNIIQPHDWTFTTDYRGTLVSCELGSIRVEKTNERINIEKLKIQEKILFYSEMVLFEDELGDNGETKLTLKLRVMPSGFFILLRLYMRVDDVIIRLYDTRMYYERGNNFCLRENTKRECVNSKLESYGIKPFELLKPDEISTKLPIVEENLEKLIFPNN